MYLQMRMAERSDLKRCISKNQALDILSKYNVPKQLKFYVLKEMEEFNLIRDLDKTTIRIINCRAIEGTENLTRQWKTKVYVKHLTKSSSSLS